MNIWVFVMTDYHLLAGALKAMAHPVRLQILDMLRQGEICVCHIENALEKRQPYISQQLMVLREAGLVDYRKEGQQVFYRLGRSDTEALWMTLLGNVDEDKHHVIDGCLCPRCVAAEAKTT